MRKTNRLIARLFSAEFKLAIALAALAALGLSAFGVEAHAEGVLLTKSVQRITGDPVGRAIEALQAKCERWAQEKRHDRIVFDVASISGTSLTTTVEAHCRTPMRLE